MTIVWCSKCGELDYRADRESVATFTRFHNHGEVRAAEDVDFDSIGDFLAGAALAHPWPETLR